MLIDFHTHIFPKDVCTNRNIYFSDSSFKGLYENEKSKIINNEGLIDYIEDNELYFAVAMAFPWEERIHMDAHNEYMGATASFFPDKIKTFGIPHIDSNIDEEVEKFKEIGISGIGELAFYSEGLNQLNEDYLHRVCTAAVKHSMPVCLHLNEPVGHKYPGKYDPEFHKIYNLIERFPELRIVLSHWGGGIFMYELMSEVKKVLQNVYYDTAASPYLYDEKIYKIAEDIVGDKILFGSDYPLLGKRRYEKEINESVDSVGVKKIMGDNAERFFKFFE